MPALAPPTATGPTPPAIVRQAIAVRAATTGPRNGPAQHDVTPILALCLQRAGQAYHVSPSYFRQMMASETALEHRNSGGAASRIGITGIPRTWLPIVAMQVSFRNEGLTAQRIASDPCAAIYAAGWIKSFMTGFTLFQAQMMAWKNHGEGARLMAKEKPWNKMIVYASRLVGVPVPLIEAVISQESGFNPYAVSPTGAIGLMQLMPATARRMGVTNPRDAEQNIFGGTVLLRRLLHRFKGNLPLVLAAYNAGSGAVLDYGGIPPYRETQAYVPDVISLYRAWTGVQSAAKAVLPTAKASAPHDAASATAKTKSLKSTT